VRKRSVQWYRRLCDAELARGDALWAAWAEVQSLHRRGLDDLRMPVRAPTPELEARPRSESGSIHHPQEPSLHDDRPSARDTAHWGITDSVEPDVLDTPVQRSLSEIAHRDVLPLPSRVRDMIADLGPSLPTSVSPALRCSTLAGSDQAEQERTSEKGSSGQIPADRSPLVTAVTQALSCSSLPEGRLGGCILGRVRAASGD
jgi:hypothetical protein